MQVYWKTSICNLCLDARNTLLKWFHDNKKYWYFNFFIIITGITISGLITSIETKYIYPLIYNSFEPIVHPRWDRVGLVAINGMEGYWGDVLGLNGLHAFVPKLISRWIYTIKHPSLLSYCYQESFIHFRLLSGHWGRIACSHLNDNVQCAINKISVSARLN